MATKAPTLCSIPGCPNPGAGRGRCAQHQADADAQRNERRALSLAVYRSAAWRRLRKRILLERPYCEWPGCWRPATDVDHKTRIEDGGDPWDEANLEPLCHPHHSAKTARETGFGGRHE